MSLFSLIPTLFGTASKVALTSMAIHREKRLSLFEENRRMLLTYFRPTSVEDTAAYTTSQHINLQKDVIAYMDGFTPPFTFTDEDKQEITDDICGIVVANFKLPKNSAESACIRANFDSENWDQLCRAMRELEELDHAA